MQGWGESFSHGSTCAAIFILVIVRESQRLSDRSAGPGLSDGFASLTATTTPTVSFAVEKESEKLF